MLEPNIEIPKVKGKPIKFTLGPYTFTRDEYGNWSRNRLNPGSGFPEFALEPHEILLCEEIIRLRNLS